MTIHPQCVTGIGPYRTHAIEAPVPCRSSKLARALPTIATGSVIASAAVWVACVAVPFTALPVSAILWSLSCAAMLVWVTAAAERRLRTRLARRPDLSGQWPLELARRRGVLARRLLGVILAAAVLTVGFASVGMALLHAL